MFPLFQPLTVYVNTYDLRYFPSCSHFSSLREKLVECYDLIPPEIRVLSSDYNLRPVIVQDIYWIGRKYENVNVIQTIIE